MGRRQSRPRGVREGALMAYVTGSPVYAVADGQPIVYASLDGQEVWRAGAAPETSLADFYGVGPGQIPGDWRIDDATVVNGEVTAVRNDGGAGALFNLGPRTNKPFPTRSGIYMVTGGGRQLALANTADLVGVHFLGVMDSSDTSTTISALLARDTGTIENYYEVRRGQFAIRGGNTTHTLITYANPGGPALYEMRWDGNEAHLIINGSIVGSTPTAALSSWPAKWIGGGRVDRDAHGFDGRLGRCVSVVMDPDHSATNPEPAVLLARQTLAAQYGIALA